MLDLLPEALVMGDEPAYDFGPRASAKRVWYVADLGQHPGTELDAETRETQDH
ncbi:hypothetical protein GCM10010145_61830 [Streptomyces ruber]|uniref:Uncharacterized protein n=2 Tax=Streptomyces TaxID=1883 RepID=A0A918BP71_9ACTN|nr:hypothetical protein GCM10010145_61830 [Streptomyces ruber]